MIVNCFIRLAPKISLANDKISTLDDSAIVKVSQILHQFLLSMKGASSNYSKKGLINYKSLKHKIFIFIDQLACGHGALV